MTEQQIDRERLRQYAACAVKLYEQTGRAPGMAVDAAEAAPQLLDQLDQAEAELDSWMARAYEAEGKLWKAEARIRHLEATAQVLVKEVLDAENARDEHRRGRAEAEARIKAVQDVLDQPADDTEGVDSTTALYARGYDLALFDVRRALESDPPPGQ